MAEPLHDEISRRSIRTALDRSLFVEAGAGTGKTSELVRRVVGIVASGRAELLSIVAITFTEAAAGELRERIRAALESQAVTDERIDVQKRCVLALTQIDDAPIQTIHAFAQRLLRQHGGAVNLPPAFDVLDSTQAALAFRSRWARFDRSLFAASPDSPSEHDRLLKTAWALGMRRTHLRGLATQLEGNFHRLRDAPPVVSSTAWSTAAASVVARVSVVLELLPHCEADDDTLACPLREQLEPWFRRLQLAIDTDDEFRLLDILVRRPAVVRAHKTKGKKQNWPGYTLAQAREALAGVDQQCEAALHGPQTWVLQSLTALLASFVLDGHRDRKRQGTLEYHDLLVLARDAAKQPAVSEALRAQYSHVFVDEFQDTDPLQAELVNSLVAPTASDPSRNLFVVGDPKQSIYRFRNADLGQYVAMRRQYGPDVTRLETNFRSLPGVLSWIDSAFAGLMTPSLGEWSSLQHGRTTSGKGSVTVIGDAVEGRSAHARERETQDVVQRLVEAREQRWCIHETDGTKRPVRYGDMAVLMPTRRALPALERSFRRLGVPYRVESRSLIWGTQEIRDVLAVLRVLDDPSDEASVIAALRSPAFGCGDDDLVAWKASGGGWNLRHLPDEVPPGVVGESMSTLQRLRAQCRWMNVPELVAFVIDDRNLFQAAFARTRQREEWHRLNFLIDQAHGWLDDGGSGLHAFLQWTTERQAEGATALESVVPDADDDAVRVMTIHAAKGLEFPLAAVIGLGSRVQNTDSARVLWTPEGGEPQLRIGPKARQWQTDGFDDAEQEDSELDAAEQIRLLYVAVTRARDHLLVSVYRSNKGTGNTLAARLHAVCGDLESISAELLTDTGGESPVATAVGGDQVQEDLAASVDRRAAVIRRASRTSSLSATAIAARVASQDRVLPVRVAGNDDVIDDLAYRLAFGSTVHAVLETIDFEAGEAMVADAVKSTADQFDLQGHEDALTRSVLSALHSDPVQEAVARRRSWREVYVTTEVGGMVIGGSIDLLYQRDEGLVIVDYKTESVAGEGALDVALERYRYQLLTYAAALEASGAGPVAEIVLLFIPPSGEPAVSAKLPAGDSVAAIQRVIED